MLANLPRFPGIENQSEKNTELGHSCFLDWRRYIDYLPAAAGRGHQFVSSQIKVQSPSCILHLHFPPLFVWSQIKAPSCSLHLHSPPPCPHPTKIFKVVHRLCYIFDIHTCGSRGMSKTGETKSAGDKCIALPQTAKASERG